MTGVFSRTFAILPRCVPGQAEERREENNRSGHSSISEPHLISAMPLLGWVSGTPELPLPPSLRSSLCLQGVETGVGAGIRRRQTVRNRREKKKRKKMRCSYPECVNADLCAGRGVLECTLSLGASFVVVGSEGWNWLLLYRPTAISHESTAFPGKTAYMVV